MSRNPRIPRDDPSDYGLWAAAAAGDEAARTALVDRAWQVAAFRLRRLPPGDRGDLQQEIAESVLRALDSGLCPDKNLDAFLEWRARAVITNYVRRRLRERSMTNLGEAAQVVGCDLAALEEVSRAEICARVIDCIRGIPNDDQRRAWLDRLERGFEPRDTAAECHVPNHRVRTWIKRGADAIRACLRGQLGGEGR